MVARRGRATPPGSGPGIGAGSPGTSSVQASAADWAAAWLTGLRLALRDVPGAELVFFQHDELIVHVPSEHADRVAALTVSAADSARDLVFPGTTVQTPVRPVAVTRYSDAK